MYYHGFLEKQNYNLIGTSISILKDINVNFTVDFNKIQSNNILLKYRFHNFDGTVKSYLFDTALRWEHPIEKFKLTGTP